MTTTATQFEVGTLVHVAPTALLIARNIREAQADKALIASVRELGVQVPITAVLDAEGALLVRQGHRRTLAAVEAACETVPVYVTGTDSTEKDDEIARIVAQRDENTHRTGLTNAEEVSVVEQLTLLGLSAAQVSKRARIKRTEVDTALTVSASSVARKATERYEALTLDQAAVVAEFEDDAETVKALIVAAHEGKFEHAAQRAREDRIDAQARDDVLALLAETGVTVIERPSYDDRTTKALTYLSADPENRTALTGEEHAHCAGHVAWLSTKWVDVDSNGQPVALPDEPDEDAGEEAWQTYEEACERINATSRQVQRPSPVYGCNGWRDHGHHDRYGSGSGSTAKPKASEMSETEREQAKKARALVIENNKAWTAAESVRRDWLRDFASRKTPPKGTAAFLATALCKDSSVAASTGGNALAADWMGVKHTGYGWADLSPAKNATENRALMIALAQVLAGYESSLSKDSWRTDGTSNSVGRYLRFIQTSGYTLSDVEKFAVSKTTA